MTEEKALSAQQENLPAEAGEGKKPGLVRGARDFIGNTFATLKGKDLNQAVEEFSGEMTLVVEGLSEDQAALRRDVDRASAEITLLEEKGEKRDKERREAIASLQKALEQEKKRADALEERLEKAEKKPQKMGLGQILRQATWMVGIICVAWVLVTVLKLIGG